MGDKTEQERNEIAEKVATLMALVADNIKEKQTVTKEQLQNIIDECVHIQAESSEDHPDIKHVEKLKLAAEKLINSYKHQHKTEHILALAEVNPFLGIVGIYELGKIAEKTSRISLETTDKRAAVDGIPFLGLSQEDLERIDEASKDSDQRNIKTKKPSELLKELSTQLEVLVKVGETLEAVAKSDKQMAADPVDNYIRLTFHINKAIPNVLPTNNLKALQALCDYEPLREQIASNLRTHCDSLNANAEAERSKQDEGESVVDAEPDEKVSAIKDRENKKEAAIFKAKTIASLKAVLVLEKNAREVPGGKYQGFVNTIKSKMAENPDIKKDEDLRFIVTQLSSPKVEAQYYQKQWFENARKALLERKYIIPELTRSAKTQNLAGLIPAKEATIDYKKTKLQYLDKLLNDIAHSNKKELANNLSYYFFQTLQNYFSVKDEYQDNKVITKEGPNEGVLKEEWEALSSDPEIVAINKQLLNLYHKSKGKITERKSKNIFNELLKIRDKLDREIKEKEREQEMQVVQDAERVLSAQNRSTEAKTPEGASKELKKAAPASTPISAPTRANRPQATSEVEKKKESASIEHLEAKSAFLNAIFEIVDGRSVIKSTFRRAERMSVVALSSYSFTYSAFKEKYPSLGDDVDLTRLDKAYTVLDSKYSKKDEVPYNVDESLLRELQEIKTRVEAQLRAANDTPVNEQKGEHAKEAAPTPKSALRKSGTSKEKKNIRWQPDEGSSTVEEEKETVEELFASTKHPRAEGKDDAVPTTDPTLEKAAVGSEPAEDDEEEISLFDAVRRPHQADLEDDQMSVDPEQDPAISDVSSELPEDDMDLFSTEPRRNTSRHIADPDAQPDTLEDSDDMSDLIGVTPGSGPALDLDELADTSEDLESDKDTFPQSLPKGEPTPGTDESADEPNVLPADKPATRPARGLPGGPPARVPPNAPVDTKEEDVPVGPVAAESPGVPASKEPLTFSERATGSTIADLRSAALIPEKIDAHLNAPENVEALNASLNDYQYTEKKLSSDKQHLQLRFENKRTAELQTLHIFKQAQGSKFQVKKGISKDAYRHMLETSIVTAILASDGDKIDIALSTKAKEALDSDVLRSILDKPAIKALGNDVLERVKIDSSPLKVLRESHSAAVRSGPPR